VHGAEKDNGELRCQKIKAEEKSKNLNNQKQRSNAMPTLKKRVSFFESEDGLRTQEILSEMTHDERFNTDSSYSADAVQYPNNLIPFVDKHMNYLNSHPGIDLDHYVSNLRLITRKR
jgi:hypothetical protein